MMDPVLLTSMVRLYNEYAPLSKALEEDNIYLTATLGWKTNARTGRLMTFGFICF